MMRGYFRGMVRRHRGRRGVDAAAELLRAALGPLFDEKRPRRVRYAARKMRHYPGSDSYEFP